MAVTNDDDCFAGWTRRCADAFGWASHPVRLRLLMFLQMRPGCTARDAAGATGYVHAPVDLRTAAGMGLVAVHDGATSVTPPRYRLTPAGAAVLVACHALIPGKSAPADVRERFASALTGETATHLNTDYRSDRDRVVVADAVTAIDEA